MMKTIGKYWNLKIDKDKIFVVSVLVLFFNAFYFLVYGELREIMVQAQFIFAVIHFCAKD